MYDLIYADPPWDQSKGGKKDSRPNSSGGELDYSTMSLQDIQGVIFKFSQKSNEDCVLFLWTIDKFLFQAQGIAENLGFKLHARMIWDKVTGIPAAFTIRYGHEYLLYMYRGKLLPVANPGHIHSVFIEQVTEHSKKPDIAYQIIEALYPNVKRIELFARSKRFGWDAWGDEV